MYLLVKLHDAFEALYTSYTSHYSLTADSPLYLCSSTLASTEARVCHCLQTGDLTEAIMALGLRDDEFWEQGLVKIEEAWKGMGEDKITNFPGVVVDAHAKCSWLERLGVEWKTIKDGAVRELRGRLWGKLRKGVKKAARE